MTVLALTMLTARCLERARIRQIEQRREPFVPDQHDIAATTSVATRRPTEGHELLATEGDGSIAPVASDDLDVRLVDESHPVDLISHCSPIVTTGSNCLRRALRRTCHLHWPAWRAF